MNGLTRFPLSPLSPIPTSSFSLLFFSLPGAILPCPDSKLRSPHLGRSEPPPSASGMAGPLPAPSPPPQSTSSHFLQASNPLTLASSNQIKQNPFPLLPRPADPAASSSGRHPPLLHPPDPTVQAPVLALQAHNPVSDLACPSHVLAPPPPAIHGSASASASAPACQSGPQLPASSEAPPAAPAVSSDPTSQVPPPLSTSLLHPHAEAHLDVQPAVPLQRTQHVRRNASTSSVSEKPPAVPPETAPLSSSAFPPLSNSLPTRPHLADAPLPAQSSGLQHRTPHVRRNAQANPLHPKSYAQAAQGSPGPGFVRAHAHAVDSFARLPRTGINVICGTRDGIPVFSLVQSDMHKVEGLYDKALVMKFHGGRPSLAASHKEISCWGLESTFSIGPLTSRSFLLRFQDERDLLKILTRPSSNLITFPYKIFRWHSRCHKNEDSVKVPLWISLPGLPLQCFAPEFLESIANRIGRFLCLDKATATLTRPSTARMCIELDLREARPQYVWIDWLECHKQPIEYERVPKFCMGCHKQGHTNVECSKKPLDTLQSIDSDPFPANQERTQAVRRNDKESSAAVSHVIPDQSRNSSFTAVSALLSASELPHQVPPRSPSAATSSEHQLCEPLPHPSSPSHPPLPAAAQHMIAVQPLLQSNVAAAPHPPLIPPPSNFTVAAETLQLCDLQSSSSEALQQQTPAVQPSLQSTVAAELLLTAPPLSGVVVASQRSIPSPPAPLLPPPCPPSAPSPPSEAQHVSNTSPESATAAIPSPTQSLSAQAPPFSPSDPLQASPQPAIPAAAEYMHAAKRSLQSTVAAISQVTAPTLSQHLTAVHQILQSTAAAESHPPQPPPPSKAVASTSSQLPPVPPPFLPVYINSNGATYVTSLPQKSLPIGYAPNPSFTLHQRHAFEGYDSENSFETDSQPISPLESPKEEANRCLFTRKSYASEGEHPTEDQPGLQGHNSDVECYHQPISSKKNKRQPDGPFRIKLRTRKGSSLHR